MESQMEELTIGNKISNFDSIVDSIKLKKTILTENHWEKIFTVERRCDKLKQRGPMALVEMDEHLQLLAAEKSAIQELYNQLDEFENFYNNTIRRLEKKENKILISSIAADFSLECKRFESALPIYSKKSEILNMIHHNQVTIITAETGSGKSTQIVQYIYQRYGNQMIVCTQPRKVAAMSLAKRVSEEMETSLGETVGYCVGANSVKNKATSICFVTDHLLLNECLYDPNLGKYKFIIIDEAHERSIPTDLLLAMVKKAVDQRPNLRLIISSATIDPRIFMTYFKEKSVHLHVSGRTFPVQVFHEEISIGNNYMQEAVRKTKQIHESEKEGDILVFLTTPVETEKAQEIIKSDKSLKETIHCLVLHGRLPPKEQQLIFDQTPAGKRKVVFATNSAETSITIPNIRYVIDTGMVKEKHYDKERNVSLLRIGPVNKSSVIQRQGRAGRTQEGKCFRLFTEEEYQEMDDEMLPEILRENLGIALLKLYQLGIEDPLCYDFVQPPSVSSLLFAQRELYELEALDNNNLTYYGGIMATLGVEPKLGKFVALAICKKIVIEAMIIVAVCSIGSSIFFRAGSEDDKQAADRLKVNFCKEHGDMITMLEIFKEWYGIDNNRKNKWCVDNSMNAKTLRYTRDIVSEMTTNLESLLDIELDKTFCDFEHAAKVIPQLLSNCFSQNVAYFSGYTRGGYFIPGKGTERFHLHPSSSLSYLCMTPKWLLFTEVLYTNRNYIINTTTIPDEIGQSLFRKVEIKTIKSQKQWIIGKATAKNLGLGKWESQLEIKVQKEINEHIYVEFDSNIGKVTLYSEDSFAAEAISLVDESISKEKVRFDRKLHDLLLSDGNQISVVLQKGGTCIEILEPGEFNSIMLCRVKENVSKADVENELKQFGPVSEVIQFRKQDYTWGKVTFERSESAHSAIKEYDRRVLLKDAVLKPAWRRGNNRLQQQSYILKARWTRRQAKGTHGFISFQNPDNFTNFVGTSKQIGNRIYQFKRSKESYSLKIEGIHLHISQDELIFGIENQYPGVKIAKCIIPRNEKQIESRDALEAIRRQLALTIGRQLGQSNERERNFNIRMIQPTSSKVVDYEAEISFKQHRDATTINKSNIVLGSAVVRFQLEKTSPVITVSKEIYHAVKDELEKNIGELQHLKIKKKIPEKKGKRSCDDVELVLESDDNERLSKGRIILFDLVMGERLKFTEDQFRYFLTPSGKQFIETLKLHGSCVVKVDQRIRSIVIYGARTARKELIEKIEEKKKLNHQNENQWIFDLNSQPNGYIKYLIQHYGVCLTKLYEEINANFININFLRHQIEVYGSIESLTKAKESLTKLSADLEMYKKNSRITNCSVSNECPVCFDTLETTSYQLEICGHSYCKECIQSMCKHAAQNKQLPLKCAKENCDKEISIENILDLTQDEEIVRAAIEIFIAKNKDNYKYCISPDCLNIYSVSRHSNPDPFQCCICQIMICTFCHIKYHDNVKCNISSRSLEEDLKSWLEEPGKDRGICPNCTAPIERFDGCLHITCLSCKSHICWRCKKVSFDSSRQCYDHLGYCGGIFR